MLIKCRDEETMLLDGSKLIILKSDHYGLPENQIFEIKHNVNKSFIKIEQFDWFSDFVNLNYSFLEKNELIEKLEINYGSLLDFQDVFGETQIQFPYFNMKYENTLLIDKDLQNIYISYFIRLAMPFEAADVVVNNEEYENYRKYFMSNEKYPEELCFSYNDRKKLFSNIEERNRYKKFVDYLESGKESKMEGICNGIIKTEKITLFKKYSFLIIRSAE